MATKHLPGIKVKKIHADRKKIEIEEFNFYKIDLSKNLNGIKFRWTINRTVEEIFELKRRLKPFRRFYVTSFDFPSKRAFTNYPNEEHRVNVLKNFLKFTLQSSIPSDFLCEFLEVSIKSFDSSTKLKEGYVFKYGSGRRNNQKRCFNFCNKIFGKKKMWLRVLPDGIEYSQTNNSNSIVEAINFCKEFKVEYGWNETEFICGVNISTSQHKFLFITQNLFIRDEFVNAIIVNFKNSDFTKGPIRFNSSFVVREQNSAKAYVDGCDYYSDVYDYLKKAKAYVAITDWWLSPELYLKRPVYAFENTKLVDILGEIAERGVKVYVILYKEITFTLTINSLYSKKTLQKRHPNIKVIRHPSMSIRGGEFLWSHHSKIVCIDNVISFIGGLDLCYGRWDSQQHIISDIDGQTWPGIDYSNVRVADFVKVDQWNTDTVDRGLIPRMPWHDIAVSVTGTIVKDIWSHFIQLWNHIIKDITGNKDRKNVLAMSGMMRASDDNHELFKNQEIKREIEEKKKAQDIKDVILEIGEPEVDKQVINIKTRFQKKRRNTQINNFVREDLDQNEDGQKKKFDFKMLFKHYVQTNLLCPYPEVAQINKLMTSSQVLSKKKEEEEQDEIETTDYLSNNTSEMQNILELGKRSSMDYINRSERENIECQLVRSAGLWSMGRKATEESIHEAYQVLIQESKKFIYIENQFFISSTAGKPVMNIIGELLINRIRRAIECSENFKVIVMIPLLPAFEGSVDDPTAAVLRVQLHYEYKTICRGKKSILTRLKQVTPNPEKYIKFYSLRTHSSIKGQPATEMIYIHSKLMIVDDTTVIVGSANINDRSLLGDRDAEVCLVITDHDELTINFDDQDFRCSKFAHNFRMNIFREHSGCYDIRVLENPFSQEFMKVWEHRANRNTRMYRKIFRCYPDDEIRNLAEVKDFMMKSRKDLYDSKKKKIKGHIVEFPLEFLKDENLNITVKQKEYLLPDETFT